VVEGVESAASNARDKAVIRGETVANDLHSCSGADHRHNAGLHSKHRDCASDSRGCNNSSSVNPRSSSNTIVKQACVVDLGDVAAITRHNWKHSVATDSTTDQATDHCVMDNNKTRKRSVAAAAEATTTTTTTANTGADDDDDDDAILNGEMKPKCRRLPGRTTDTNNAAAATTTTTTATTDDAATTTNTAGNVNGTLMHTYNRGLIKQRQRLACRTTDTDNAAAATTTIATSSASSAAAVTTTTTTTADAAAGGHAAGKLTKSRQCGSKNKVTSKQHSVYTNAAAAVITKPASTNSDHYDGGGDGGNFTKTRQARSKQHAVDTNAAVAARDTVTKESEVFKSAVSECDGGGADAGNMTKSRQAGSKITVKTEQHHAAAAAAHVMKTEACKLTLTYDDDDDDDDDGDDGIMTTATQRNAPFADGQHSKTDNPATASRVTSTATTRAHFTPGQ